ncbi:MAG: hypothetical protein KZQ80_12920 [Candidatus Thiodiazotropha sp. (ex Monitilora ramsayi)]|nr:hypothetical protein [Candidatus Thiodiazotropha sp. (ex Monitilora ramsayi)]
MTAYIEGEVYFRLVYPDVDMSYPIVQSFVYVGKNLSDEDQEDTWYFQFADDYAQFGSFIDSSQGERRVCCETQTTVSCMLDIESLANELLLAESRRQR